MMQPIYKAPGVVSHLWQALRTQPTPFDHHTFLAPGAAPPLSSPWGNALGAGPTSNTLRTPEQQEVNRYTPSEKQATITLNKKDIYIYSAGYKRHHKI